MVCSNHQRLRSLSVYKFGLFLICQQMIHVTSGINISLLDLGQTITRIAYRDFTDVYVGGVNFVAQLTPNLGLLFNFPIGPVKTKEHCAPYSAPCDNYVKVLEIDIAHNMLLVCGSAYRGTCTLHSLVNIYDWYCLYGDKHRDGADIISGGGHEQTPVVHFLTPTIETPKSGQDQESIQENDCRTADFGSEVMTSNNASPKTAKSQLDKSGTGYIRRRSGGQRSKRTSRTFLNMERKKEGDNFLEKRAVMDSEADDLIDKHLSFQSNFIVAGNGYNPGSSLNPPVISLRSMTFVGSQYTIGYARDQNSKPVGLDVEKSIPSSDMPDYKLSFTWKDYSYFLFIQKTFECEKTGPCIVTKISRTCHDPSSVSPYVEIPLSCDAKNNKKYRLLTAATVGTVGLQLASSYVTIPILLMAFGNGSDPLSTTADPSYGTAVCAMTLDYLDKRELNYVLDTCSEAVDHELAKPVSWISGKQQRCQWEPVQGGKCTPNTKNKYVQGTGFIEITATHQIKDITVTTILTHTHTYTSVNQSTQTPIEKMTVFLITNVGNFKQFTLSARKDLDVFSTDADSSLTESFNMSEHISSQPIGITDHAHAVMYVASGHKIMELDLEFCLQFQTCAACHIRNDRCLWCPRENNCRARDIAQVICQGATFNKCPPRVDSFSPMKVPIHGGSMLTVIGADLGVQGEGSVNVTVCNQQCDNVVPNNHTVTCQVKKKCDWCSNKCSVTVTVNDQKKSDGTTSSAFQLEYMSPNVTSFSPKFGPASGGTVVTIHGQNLKIGSSTKITVGGARCDIVTDTDDLLCRITQDNNRKPHYGDIVVSIDNFITTLWKEKFEFRPNPRIDDIRPKATIASGGVTVTVDGLHLNTVESPLISLIVPHTAPGSNTNFTTFSGNCTLKSNNRQMICKTPDVKKYTMEATNTTVDVIIGGTNLPYWHPTSLQMIIYADPIFLAISNTPQDADIYSGDTTFTVRGERIPDWIDYSDIIVTIGNVTLDITEVEKNYIKCDVKKAIDMYDLQSRDIVDNIIHTEEPNFGSNDTHVTSASNFTNAIYTTLVPTVRTKTTLKKTSFKSTTVSKGHPKRMLYYSLKNGTNNETKINVPFSESPESLNNDGRNGTENLRTVTPHDLHFTTIKNKRRKAIKYKVKIKIGNYEKDLGYVTISSSNMSSKSQVSPAQLDFKLIAGASGAGLLLVVLVVVSCVMYVRARKARALVKVQAFYMGSLSGSQHGSREAALPSLKQILQSVIEPDKRADMDRLIINLDRLTVGKSIGSGNFGCVFEGFLTSGKDTQAEKVAVKTLQDPSSHNIDLHAFVQEAVIMREFQHPHVLGLIGLAEKEPGIPYVILPYMDNGDLLTFIRDSSVSVSLHDVIKFGADIANGMAYLSALKFVHRDLAARNCMLDDLYRVKVADFGLCRDIYEKGYYTSDNRKKLPVRWMAVESIEHGAYSSKSDVWSLGVVLWELLSRGVTPYPGVNGWDIVNFLGHRRLPPPYFCPEKLFDLMMQCWAKDPNCRPDFITIQTELLRMIGQSPNITDTIKRRRRDNYPEVLKNANMIDTSDDNQTKEKAYVNVSPPDTAAINNVLITIPKCYSHRDVSKTAAGMYIQLVDNYEPPPKFSNHLLRSMRKHIGKTQDRYTKASKRAEQSKSDISGYSCPGEYPVLNNSGSEVTDNRSRCSEGNVANIISRESQYYELEGTSMRTSAVSENHSGWSMLNNTGSSASGLDAQSRDSSMSASRSSTTSNLTVPNSLNRPPSSPRGTVFKIQNSSAPDSSPEHKKRNHLQIEKSGMNSRNRDLTHL